MVSGYLRLSLKSPGENLPVLLLIVFAIIIAIAAAGRNTDRAVHEAVMMNLRAVDVNHASLQRDVLRARAGLLQSYDGLVHSVVNLRRATTELSDLFGTPQFDNEGKLRWLILELRAAIDRDEILVDGFKTRNALLQNSIGVFGQTLTALHESQDKVVQRALSRASDLGNLMMRFSTRPDEDLQGIIVGRLDQLSEFDTAAPVLEKLGTVIVHAKMILAVLPRVDSKIAAIHASRAPVRAEELQSEYLNIAADATSRASLSRIMLGTMASILSVYICVLIYRLREQTRRLKHRLHYEQIIADVKAEMVDCSPEDFPAVMRKALKVISCFYGARTGGIAICNAEREELRDAYQLEDSKKQLLVTFARELCRENETPTIRLHNRGTCGKTIRLCRSADPLETVPSLLVGAKLAEQDVAILMFFFKHTRSRVTPDEMQLLQSTLKTLTEFIEANRSRQERQGLEHRLEHAQRLEAVGTLAGGIAHEFNNVLGAILGYGEMAIQLLRTPSPTRHYVQEILKSGARAKHIVDQILTFSRKRERIVKPFDVGDAVTDIIPLLQVTLGNRVAIESRLCQSPAVIEGNPVEVHQLAMNLCKNASQASSRGQKVTIEVRTMNIPAMRPLTHGEISSGSYVCLVVKDEGPGIPEHILPHIFEPFFTTNSRSGGSGLGLSAVHGIVSSLNGGINVKSTPGTGAVFELFLPATNLVPLPIDSFFDERAVPTGNGERIVIVVQDRLLLELYEEKVAALSYEPIGCSSMDCLQAQLDAGLCADMLILDQKCLTAKFDFANIDIVFGKGRLLLLSDRASELPPKLQHLQTRVLKTPFSSAALANAIFDRLTR